MRHQSVSHCPDCGEPLEIHRGVIPLSASIYCPSCQWCEIQDGARGEDEKEDYLNRYCSDYKEPIKDDAEERYCEREWRNE